MRCWDGSLVRRLPPAGCLPREESKSSAGAAAQAVRGFLQARSDKYRSCISGLVVEYIVAIDVIRVRFPADAYALFERDTCAWLPGQSSLLRVRGYLIQNELPMFSHAHLFLYASSTKLSPINILYQLLIIMLINSC